MRSSLFRIIIIYTVVVALPLLRPSQSAAVSTCGTTCSSNCALTADIVCSAGQDGVTLANGADLDLAGHAIICDDDQNGCGSAVKMLAGASLAQHGSILGTWMKGVACQSTGGSVAFDLVLRGYFWHAIDSCSFVFNNTIAGTPLIVFDGVDSFTTAFSLIGIYQANINNNDAIHGNYIDGVQSPIARSPGGPVSQLLIERNAINFRLIDPNSSVAAIALGSNIARPVTVKDNIFTGDSPKGLISTFGQSPTYINNICKRGLGGCSGCVASGQCVANGTTTSP